MKKIILLLVLPFTILMAIDFTMTEKGLFTETTTTVTVPGETSSYLEPINLPECDASNPEVQFIRSKADWNTINSSSKRIFCVSPGDYRSLNNIKLTTSGTAEKRRYIILNNGNDLHPGKLDKSKLANFSLSFSGASYWTVDRLASIDSSIREAVGMNGGSTYNIINRAFTKNAYISVKIKGKAHNNTIQNCRFQDMLLSARKSDTPAIKLHEWGVKSFEIRNTKIINNEIINANDGIQLVRSPINDSSGDYQDANCEGTIIDNNDIYITSDIYTDGSGNLAPNGVHAYAENAIDLKIGSTNVNNPIYITNNRVWGYRQSDQTGSNLSSPGSAISGHYEIKYTKINNNIIFDSHYGLNSGASYNFPYAEDEMEILNNLFYACGKLPGASKGGHAIGIGQGRNVDIKYNTIINSRTEYARIQYNGTNIQFAENTVINSPDKVLWNNNANGSYNGSNNVYSTSEEAVYTEDYVFTTDKFTNNPRIITLENAVKPN